MKIDGVAHGVDVPLLGQIEMGDLAQRMDAGIGSSGGADSDRLARECADCSGQHTLHRDAVILRLPADE